MDKTRGKRGWRGRSTEEEAASEGCTTRENGRRRSTEEVKGREGCIREWRERTMEEKGGGREGRIREWRERTMEERTAREGCTTAEDGEKEKWR